MKVCLYLCDWLCRVLNEKGPGNVLRTPRRKDAIPRGGELGKEQGTDKERTLQQPGQPREEKVKKSLRNVSGKRQWC